MKHLMYLIVMKVDVMKIIFKVGIWNKKYKLLNVILKKKEIY